MEESLQTLLSSQDTQSGAFFNEVMKVPVDVITEEAMDALNADSTGHESSAIESVGTISLTTTAQMAGVLAQYSYLYKNDNPELSLKCLKASQSAYGYMEKYRGNTDTDAWYYAAVQLYRATGQYKYRNAIAEYDTIENEF